MPEVHFTDKLHNVVPKQHVAVPGDNVLAALHEVFAHYPRLKSYLLDDQGQLRKAVRIYHDGRQLTLLNELRSRIDLTARIYVF